MTPLPGGDPGAALGSMPHCRPMRPARFLAATLLLLGLMGGLSSAAPPGAPAARSWEWSVTVAPDLGRLEVRLCLRQFLPRRLTLRSAGAGVALLPAGAGPGRHALVAGPEGFELEGAGGLEATSVCCEYALDLKSLAGVRGAGLERVGRALLLDPRAWLLAPALWPADVEAVVRWSLPPGWGVSAPWQLRADGSWALPPSALLGESLVALGPLVERRFEASGAAVHVAMLDGPVAASPAGVDGWISAAMRTVAGLYGGRFPQPRVQVVVRPVPPGGDPVPFGEAQQAGGGAVHVLLAADARDADLPGEWVLVHELTHLGMPWIAPEDAWLNEGFVTYYQEVLRGRSGFLGADGPWQALHEGFERGRRGGARLPLAEESRRMHERHAYHRVYWGGAALALRCDLALRAATAGQRSLDDVMRLWASPQFAAVPGGRALDLLRAADRALGTRVLVATVEGPLGSPGFPALDEAYAALGLTASGARVALAPEAPARSLRLAVGGPR